MRRANSVKCFTRRFSNDKVFTETVECTGSWTSVASAAHVQQRPLLPCIHSSGERRTVISGKSEKDVGESHDGELRDTLHE